MGDRRDEDLDWLYGDEPSSDPGPEPTRVLGTQPPEPPPNGRPVQPSSGPTPPPARPVRPVPAPPPQVGADQSIVSGRPQGPSGPSDPSGPGDGAGGPGGTPPKKPRRPRRTVRILLAVLVAALIGFIAVPVYAWSQVGRVDDDPGGDRPADQPGTTFLLLGSDSREGLTKAEQKKLGTGSTKGQRTDTIMMLHIPSGGKPALISLPRDSYVPIPGNGSNKINAAFSFGGPRLMVQTIESNTGLRIDGYLEVGFGGFVNVIDALGGIEMCLPRAIKDKKSHLDLKKGCQDLSGANALGYVRMRYADPKGDLGRVERQRQMLSAVTKKAASPASVLNPVRYWRLTNSAAGALKLGEDTSSWEMVKLMLAMRTISSGGGYTLTVPISNPDFSSPVGSAVKWDTEKAMAMFGDLKNGDTSKMGQYAQ